MQKIKIKELMTPIDHYTTISEEASLKEAFIAFDGRLFFRTGDLGYYDEDGFFYIADRLKRMINAAGYKVWPAELEATLYKHPDIKEVAIISSPDKRRGETVKAVVVPSRLVNFVVK